MTDSFTSLTKEISTLNDMCKGSVMRDHQWCGAFKVRLMVCFKCPRYHRLLQYEGRTLRQLRLALKLWWNNFKGSYALLNSPNAMQFPKPAFHV
jgi:hypothetical protein